MENPSNSLVYPLRDSTALYAIGSHVLDIDIPPKSPFGKGGLRQGSSPKASRKQKFDGKSIELFGVPPQGLEPWTLALRVLCSTN